MNLGKWDRWYVGATRQQAYGDVTTYELGAEFLAPCTTVEDWGCGYGWFAKHLPRARGIDGSLSPFADEIVDLADYRSDVEGIFMRHVLEHDDRWPAILDNALGSFSWRMVLVVFTPWAEKTGPIAMTDLGVPDIAFRQEDLTERFVGCRWSLQELETATYYGVEHLFRVEREP